MINIATNSKNIKTPKSFKELKDLVKSTPVYFKDHDEDDQRIGLIGNVVCCVDDSGTSATHGMEPIKSDKDFSDFLSSFDSKNPLYTK